MWCFVPTKVISPEASFQACSKRFVWPCARACGSVVRQYLSSLGHVLHPGSGHDDTPADRVKPGSHPPTLATLAKPQLAALALDVKESFSASIEGELKCTQLFGSVSFQFSFWP
jgi:hypothetical protein